MTRAWTIVNTLGVLVATGVAAAVWWPVYETPRFILLVAVAAAVGCAIAVLGALSRWPSAIVVPVTLLAFALIGVPLAVPDKTVYGVVPTLEGYANLLSGVALGWKQLLTITLPVGTYQGLLVPILVLVLLGTVIALSVALRAPKRGDLAVLPAVVIFLTGIAFGPRDAHWPLQLALGLLATILLWLMWRRWYRRRTAIRLHSGSNPRLLGVRTIVSALVVMAVAGGSAVAATAALPPTTDREVLRTSIEQPFDPQNYPSPLAGFRSYLKNGTADETIMTVTGLPAGQRIRVATLDSYDGIVYAVGSDVVSSESGSFTRVPYRYDQSAVTGDQVSLGIELGDYSGVWLPTVGKFESVDFNGSRAVALREQFYYNDTASTAAVIGGLAGGDSYTLDAVLPQQPSDTQLASSTAGSAIVPLLSTVPAELSTALERYSGSVDGQGAKLVAAIRGLQADGYISHGIGADEPPSRSGHSSDRITQLLTDQRMIGDAEQYAVTAALMARELGFPARVVFGFDPNSDGGTVVVTGDMVSAWIEVNTAQYGWVSIETTPPPRAIPEEQPEEPSAVSRPQSVIQPPEEEQDLTDNQTPIESSQDDPLAVDGWLVVLGTIVRALGWVLLGAALIASPFLVIIAAKLRRRQLRRRAASPLARISGGWREFEDAVVDHGLVPPRAATRSEFAATVGGSQSAIIAAVADRAVFAPAEPDADDATRLWRSVDELRASLSVGKTRWQRLKARVSLRSLGGRKSRRRGGGAR